MRVFSRFHFYARIFRVFIAVLVCAALALTIGWVVNRGFVLQQIMVTGDQVAVEIDKNRLGKNLLFLHTRNMEEELLSAYPLLASARVTKQFPSTLMIEVRLRTPALRLVTPSQSYLLDREGVVLGNPIGAGELVELRFDLGSLSIGSKPQDRRITQSIVLIQHAADVPIDVVSAKDASTLQIASGKTNIFVPQNADMISKAATLQTIVAGFRIKGSLPAVIDLRFDKPVITY